MRDDDVRSSCFAALDVLQAKWGADVPYEALAQGFNFRGRRVPFLNRAYGIYRAADAQRGPAGGAVLPAYQDRCAIFSLREVCLLDAAHIVADAEEAGEPVVSNGLSLCSIHHRAFDKDLVGVAPNLRVHVSRPLLDDEDGPMLDVLKGFHGATIEAPAKRLWRPDPDRLARRFERFEAAA